MKHLWQRLINKIARKLKSFGTLDSERALRKKNAEILHLKQELEQAQKRQWGYEHSAWNSEPVPQTDPRLLAQLEAQKRKDDMKAFLHCKSQELPRMPGDMARKYKIRKLDDVTVIMPAIQRDAQLQRYNQMRYQEDAWIR